MISNHLKSVFSFNKHRRDILWVGSKSDLPPKGMGDLLAKIQFVTKDRLTSIKADAYVAIVYSLNYEDPPNQELLQTLAKAKLAKFLIFNDVNCNFNDNSQLLLNQLHFDKVFLLPDQLTFLVDALKNQFLSPQKSPSQVPMDTESVLALENEYTDLESLAQKGTEHIASAKREIELKVTRMRKLIRFLEQLATLHSIEELMKLIRLEIKEFHHLKDPVLVIGALNQPAQVYYFQGVQVLKKTMKDSWPSIYQARFNDARDSQYLANVFSRPFARLFSIPIQIRQGSAEDEEISSGVIYFEHSLQDEQKYDFVEYLEERLHLIGVALDRLFLESDLREASIIWEKTFDEIADPVAIFDDDKKLVRSNKAFQLRFSEMDPPGYIDGNLQYNGRTFEVRRYPIVGADGTHSTNVVIHYLDITLAHQLQKQMIQQEKMAALGHLAGNIAHELNNPLTGIQSMAQILAAKTDIDASVKSDLLEVESAAERCQKIIKNLLDFSKGEASPKHERTDMNSIVQNTLPLLKTLISLHELELDLTQKENPINVEPQLFQQVVFNLIKNACQAMSQGGRMLIKTQVTAALPAVVELIIEDNGPGMSEDVKTQIFDYFFTTKPKGEGTGLGLSMSKSIVQSFGGEINVQSELKKGTQFRVSLPLAGAEK